MNFLLSGINSGIFPPTNPSGPQNEEPKINSTLIEVDLRYLFEDRTENIDQALEILNIASSGFNCRFKKGAIKQKVMRHCIANISLEEMHIRIKIKEIQINKRTTKILFVIQVIIVLRKTKMVLGSSKSLI